MNKIVKKVNCFEERWLGEYRCLVKINLSDILFYDTVVKRAMKVVCKYGFRSLSMVCPVVIIEGGPKVLHGKINEIAEQVFNYILFGIVIPADGWELDELNWSSMTVLGHLANLRKEFSEYLDDLRREYASVSYDLQGDLTRYYSLNICSIPKPRQNWEEVSRKRRLEYSLIANVYTDFKKFAKEKGFYRDR